MSSANTPTYNSSSQPCLALPSQVAGGKKKIGLKLLLHRTRFRHRHLTDDVRLADSNAWCFFPNPEISHMTGMGGTDLRFFPPNVAARGSV